MSKMIHSYRS